MQFQNKITPFLAFEDAAEAAAKFYVSILPDSRILKTVPRPETDAAMTVEFEIAGLTVVALNTGHSWEFNETFSLAVACETQAEIDTLWDALLEGGEPLACGWLKDKFGVRWQIVPAKIGAMLGDPDPVRAKRVYDAMLQMIKLDIATLEAAYAG